MSHFEFLQTEWPGLHAEAAQMAADSFGLNAPPDVQDNAHSLRKPFNKAIHSSRPVSRPNAVRVVRELYHVLDGAHLDRRRPDKTADHLR